VSVRINGGHNQENSHSRKQEGAELIKVLTVFQKEIADTKSYISKPQKVRNYKKFHKGNLIVNTHMYQMEIVGNVLFQPCEPWKINQCIDGYPAMFIFLKKIFH